MKFEDEDAASDADGRAPRGARGLKFLLSVGVSAMLWSRPSRGAWIEMLLFCIPCQKSLVAPLAGRVD